MTRPTIADLALLARLMAEGEITQASLSSSDQRTARRLVEAYLAFQYAVQPTPAMMRDGLETPLMIYHLDAAATRALCDAVQLAAVLARLPGLLDVDGKTA
jgi:hypothetical protein